MLNLASVFTAIDGTPQVPMMVMICMATTLLLSVVPSVFLIIRARKQYKGSFVSLFFGLAMYAVFDLVLLTVVTVTWKNIAEENGNAFIMPFLEAFLKGFIGIFARGLMIFAIAKSKLVDNSNSLGNAVIAGTGYTIYRSIQILLSTGWGFVMALTINMFGIGSLTADMDDDMIDGMADIYEAFLTTPAYEFLVDGIRFLLILAVSVSLSIIIYAAYNKKTHRVLVAFALLVNVLFELPFTLRTYELAFDNVLIAILVASVFAVWMALLAYKTMNVSLKNEVKAMESEIKNAKKKAFPDFNANIKK